jgi:hypothetical protein
MDATVGAIMLAVASAATGALVWWVTLQAATGRLARNRTTGIRTRQTLASDEHWVRGHEIALPWTVAGRYAAGVVALATLAAVGAGRPAPLGLVLGVAGLVTVLLTCLAAVLAIHRALPD